MSSISHPIRSMGIIPSNCREIYLYLIKPTARAVVYNFNPDSLNSKFDVTSRCFFTRTASANETSSSGQVSLWSLQVMFNWFILVQVYFQRVLACRTSQQAQVLSYAAAAGCLLLAVPPAILGSVARAAGRFERFENRWLRNAWNSLSVRYRLGQRHRVEQPHPTGWSHLNFTDHPSVSNPKGGRFVPFSPQVYL